MKVRRSVFVTDSYSSASLSVVSDALGEDDGSGMGLSRYDEARRGLFLEDLAVREEELPALEGEAVLQLRDLREFVRVIWREGGMDLDEVLLLEIPEFQRLR